MFVRLWPADRGATDAAARRTRRRSGRARAARLLLRAVHERHARPGVDASRRPRAREQARQSTAHASRNAAWQHGLGRRLPPHHRDRRSALPRAERAPFGAWNSTAGFGEHGRLRRGQQGEAQPGRHGGRCRLPGCVIGALIVPRPPCAPRLRAPHGPGRMRARALARAQLTAAAAPHPPDWLSTRASLRSWMGTASMAIAAPTFSSARSRTRSARSCTVRHQACSVQ